MTPTAPQRAHDLREASNAVRWLAAGAFEAVMRDLRPAAGEPGPHRVVQCGDCGSRAGYDGHKRTRGPRRTVPSISWGGGGDACERAGAGTGRRA